MFLFSLIRFSYQLKYILFDIWQTGWLHFVFLGNKSLPKSNLHKQQQWFFVYIAETEFN